MEDDLDVDRAGYSGSVEEEVMSEAQPKPHSAPKMPGYCATRRRIRVRKYQVGAGVFSIHTVIEILLAGGYMMVRGKPTHPAWILSWPVSMLLANALGGCLARAELTPEYVEMMKGDAS
jgi:hypothetical protein